MELTDIKGVGEKKAEELKQLGINSVEELANYEGDEIPDSLVEKAMQALSPDDNSDEPGPARKFSFTPILGMFASQPISYRAGDPAMRVKTSLLPVSDFSIEKVGDEELEEGKTKFKLMYKSNWSSVVMNDSEFIQFKIAIAKGATNKPAFEGMVMTPPKDCKGCGK